MQAMCCQGPKAEALIKLGSAPKSQVAGVLSFGTARMGHWRLGVLAELPPCRQLDAKALRMRANACEFLRMLANCETSFHRLSGLRQFKSPKTRTKSTQTTGCARKREYSEVAPATFRALLRLQERQVCWAQALADQHAISQVSGTGPSVWHQDHQ